MSKLKKRWIAIAASLTAVAVVLSTASSVIGML